MAQLTANGIRIEYDTFGSEADRPLLLIMGLGAQMTRWPEAFCNGLADQGHYVIRFDNRDVGLSERFESAGAPDIAALTAAVLEGRDPNVAYRLEDMAADAAGLLDALEMDAAHVCGASLGGMIAQTLAIQSPERVLSLTSIMSSTGNRELPPATPEAMAALLSPPAQDRDDSMARAEAISRVIGSPGFPADPVELRERAAADYERAFYPVGVARQMAAATVQADRRAALSQVPVPALVIHGKEDPLVPLAGGIDTHQSLARSTLWSVEGMGHDLPRALWDEMIARISTLTSSV